MKVDDKLVQNIANAWNDYPDGARSELMLSWPELFFSVSWLVRTMEVKGKLKDAV